MTSPVVDQCVVIGDRKPFIAAIVSLDLDETNAWLAAQGVEQVSDLAEAVRNPIVYAEVERAVNAANDLVSRAESIRKFEIVPEPFTEENGLLTASMKARRQAVIDHFGAFTPRRAAERKSSRATSRPSPQPVPVIMTDGWGDGRLAYISVLPRLLHSL